MATVFAIFMTFFGMAYVYSAVIESHVNRNDSLYFLFAGFMCITIASTILFISVKLYHHR